MKTYAICGSMKFAEENRAIRTGILICGLNGSGKSTLGKVLAEKLGFHFIDSEDIFFAQKNDYNSQRSHKEATDILLSEIKKHPDFVFSSVKGEFGESFISHLKYAVFIEVQEEIRLKRVRNRDVQKFGDRVLQGGDLFDSTENFYKFIQSRDDTHVTKWLDNLDLKVIRIDGTKDINENVNLILGMIK